MDPIATLVEELKSIDPIVRGAAARALGAYQHTIEQRLESLVDKLFNPDRLLHKAAAKEIKELVPDAASLLADFLIPASGDCKEQFAATLKLFVPGGASVVQSLLPALHDSELAVRITVVDSLRAVGNGAEAAIPDLVELLGDDQLHAAAAAALRAIGAGGHAQIARLAPLLAAADSRVRVGAAQSLAAIRRERYWDANEAGIVADRADMVACLDRLDPTAIYEYIPALLAMLTSSLAEERRSASELFEVLSPVAGSAARQLVAALLQNDSEGAATAGAMLRQIGPDPSSSTAALLARLNSIDPDVRRAAASVIENDCRQLAPFGRHFGDERLQRQLSAVHATAFAIANGWVDAVLPHLCTAAVDSDYEVRAAIARCFGNLFEAAIGGNDAWMEWRDAHRDIINEPMLEDVLNDDLMETIGICHVLADDEEREQTLHCVGSLLQDKSIAVRRAAAAALVSAAGLAKSKVPLLAQAAQDSDSCVRRSALLALRRLGGGAATTVPILVERLAADDPQERILAVDALAAVGKRALLAAEPLRAVVRTNSQPSALRAAIALANIDPKQQEGVSTLQLALRADDHSIRLDAACALARSAPATPGLLDVLTAALAETESLPRCRAAGSLGRMGSLAALAAPKLLEMRGDPDRCVRMAAMIALTSIEPAADSLAFDLCALIQESTPETRGFATIALSAIGKASTAAVGALLKVFTSSQDDESEGEGNLAALTLGEMGDLAAPAIPAFIQALGNPSKQQVAMTALGGIPGASAALTDWLQSHAAGDLSGALVAAARHARGKSYSTQERYAEAIVDFSAVLENDPDDVDAYHDRARAYYFSGNLDAAIADCNELLELDPCHVMGLELRGDAHRRQGDYPSALVDLDRKLSLCTSSNALNIRGIVHKKLGRLEEALADYDEAIRMEPTKGQYYSNRGLAHVATGDYARAIGDHEVAVNIDPDYFGAYCSLAWLLATCADDSIRDGARAVEIGRQACELSTWTCPNSIDTLAAAYAEQGDFAQAIEQETLALQFPDFAERAGARERLAGYRRSRPYREDRGHAG